MDLNLVARLGLDDRLTRPLRRVSDVFGRLDSATRTTDSGLSRVSGTMNRQVSRANGLTKSVAGIAGAYLSARSAVELFNATVGEAMKYEQSEVAIEAIFNDKSLSDSYLKIVDKLATDSPLLNSSEMLSSSKGLVAMTKNVDELGDAWGIIEKLMVLDPTQGTEGAAFALKEMFQGDSMSMVERFGLSKKDLNRIKKLSLSDQLVEIDKLLAGMGITQSVVNDMGSTTAGYWAQITERAGKFMRTLGESGNSKIGDLLASIVTKLDSIDLEALASKIDNVVGTALEKAITSTVSFINTAKDVAVAFKDNWPAIKEAIIGVTTAVVAFKVGMLGLAIVQTVTALIKAYQAGTLLATAAQLLFNGAMSANPIGLIIMGIAALIGIIVVLYRNWDTVTAKMKEVWAAIGSGSGFIAIILGPLGFLINAAIDLAKNWDSSKSIWENVWGAIQRSAATSINAVVGLINKMIETINKIPGVNIPIVAKVDWGAATAPSDLGSAGISNAGVGRKSHYNGIEYVPYDGYQATLHRGEKVVTAREAKAKRGMATGGSPISISGNTFHVRQESDIEDIAMKIARLIEQEGGQMR